MGKGLVRHVVLLALLTGTADVVRDLPIDQVVSMTESGKFDVSIAPPYVGYSFLGFPSSAVANVPALGDVRVRTAIMKAIDRQAIVKIKMANGRDKVMPDFVEITEPKDERDEAKEPYVIATKREDEAATPQQ